QAGSLTEGASSEVRIMRPKNGGQPEAAMSPDKPEDAQITVVNINRLLTGDAGTNIQLQDGDTIWVPTAERFFIIGNVRNVGPYIHQPGLTVQQALALAG